MDFQAALAVLQARSGSADARPVAGDASTATTGPVTCSECAAEAGAEEATRTPRQPSEVAALSDAALLRLFLARQEERVAVYRRFEEGFLLFLQVAEANGYEALVKSTTATFATISAGVNTVEAELRTRSLPLADAVRRVQGIERDKLELTARLQILRHALAVDKLHADGIGADSAGAATAARTATLRAEEAREVEAKLAELTVRLNEELDEVRAELCDSLDEGEEDEAAVPMVE
jgi:hypothetical protein